MVGFKGQDDGEAVTTVRIKGKARKDVNKSSSPDNTKAGTTRLSTAAIQSGVARFSDWLKSEKRPALSASDRSKLFKLIAEETATAKGKASEMDAFLASVRKNAPRVDAGKEWSGQVEISID